MALGPLRCRLPVVRWSANLSGRKSCSAPPNPHRRAFAGFRIDSWRRSRNDTGLRPSNILWYAFGTTWDWPCCWQQDCAWRRGNRQPRRRPRPAARRQRARIRKRRMLTARKAAPAAETPQPPPAPLTPEQMPPTPPQVTYQNGLLTIDAKNSTLSQVLRAVQAQTGASVEMPSSAANERVMMQVGPGRAARCTEHAAERVQV